MHTRIAFTFKFAFVALLVFLCACSKNKNSNHIAPVYPGGYPADVKIEYRVTGIEVTSLNSITYTSAKGDEVKLNEVVLPFSVLIDPKVNKDDAFNLNVLHTMPLDTGSFSVILEVWVDNKLQKTITQSSSNGSVVATLGLVFQ